MRDGPGPRSNNDGNNASQLAPVGGESLGQKQTQQPGLVPAPSIPHIGVLSFEQAQQHHRRALTTLPKTDPHPDTPIFLPTPPTINYPPALTRTATAASTTGKSKNSRYSANIANVDQHHYGDNTDALAALTFLEHEVDAVPRLPRQERRVPASEAEAVTAAIPRPGKGGGANGKYRRVVQDAWAESSDEEEEAEEEDDEDLVSDGDCVFPTTPSFRDTGLVLISFRIGDQDGRYHQQVPGTPGPSTFRRPSEHYANPTRSQGFDIHMPPLQPQGQGHPRPPYDFPTPGTARQTIWSQALENEGAQNESDPQRETFVQVEPSDTMAKAFVPHGLLYAGLMDRQERSAKLRKEVVKETGASPMNIPTEPFPPQTGFLGAIPAHEPDRRRKGGIGVALTERDRQERPVEERQRKRGDIRNGSTYGSQFGPGPNPMIANLMMMGMNPMTSTQQQVFAAQQAATEAYQQTMMSFGQNVGQSRAGGDELGGSMGGMGGPVVTGQFDPRMLQMGTPMVGIMGMNMDMGPVSQMMIE